MSFGGELGNFADETVHNGTSFAGRDASDEGRESSAAAGDEPKGKPDDTKAGEKCSAFGQTPGQFEAAVMVRVGMSVGFE